MKMPILLPLLSLMLPGCIAKTAVDVVTLPVKAGAKAVDWATTSQDEADRNRGREIRKAEEKEREAEKKRIKACRKEGRTDCDLGQGSE